MIQTVVAFAVAGVGQIRVDPSGFFVDETGRARIFHGVNAVEKVPPFHPQVDGFDPVRSLSDIDAKQLQSWGMNVVRLGVLWQAVVPHADGQINHEYLGNISKLVNILGENGIFSLLDMHQDVLGARFCGEGLANWTVAKIMNASGFNLTDPATRFAQPLAPSATMGIDPATQYPSRPACLNHTFSEYYNTFESLAAWDTFFATPELWDDCGDHWEAVASTFAGVPSVLGYELINEPWGNATLLKASSDKARLLPLYQKLHERIRAVDDDHIIFYESQVLNEAYGHSTDFPAGGPGGVTYNDRQAFSYHIYCLDSLPVVHVSCAAAYDIGWKAVTKSRAIVGGGSMLTEFGAVSQTAVDIDLITTMLDPADKFMQSWSYWNFKTFDDITTTGDADGGESFYNKDGSVQFEKVRALTRTYAPAIAGMPTKMHFDNSTGDEIFTLQFTATDDVTGVTEIFAQRELHYSDGVSVAIVPPTAATWRQSTSDVNMLEVIRTGAQAGDSIAVVVRRATTCKCAQGSTDADGCCISCKTPPKCPGKAAKTPGNWCGNDFHAAYCGNVLPMCCTSDTGRPVCCPTGSSCKAGPVQNTCKPASLHVFS